MYLYSFKYVYGSEFGYACIWFLLFYFDIHLFWHFFYMFSYSNVFFMSSFVCLFCNFWFFNHSYIHLFVYVLMPSFVCLFSYIFFLYYFNLICMDTFFHIVTQFFICLFIYFLFPLFCSFLLSLLYFPDFLFIFSQFFCLFIYVFCSLILLFFFIFFVYVFVISFFFLFLLIFFHLFICLLFCLFTFARAMMPIFPLYNAICVKLSFSPSIEIFCPPTLIFCFWMRMAIIFDLKHRSGIGMNDWNMVSLICATNRSKIFSERSTILICNLFWMKMISNRRKVLLISRLLLKQLVSCSCIRWEGYRRLENCCLMK